MFQDNKRYNQLEQFIPLYNSFIVINDRGPCSKQRKHMVHTSNKGFLPVPNDLVDTNDTSHCFGLY